MRRGTEWKKDAGQSTRVKGEVAKSEVVAVAVGDSAAVRWTGTEPQRVGQWSGSIVCRCYYLRSVNDYCCCNSVPDGSGSNPE